jgi:hypothetical protein
MIFPRRRAGLPAILIIDCPSKIRDGLAPFRSCQFPYRQVPRGSSMPRFLSSMSKIIYPRLARAASAVCWRTTCVSGPRPWRSRHHNGQQRPGNTQSRLSTRENRISGVSGTTVPEGMSTSLKFLVDTSNRGLQTAVQFRHPGLWHKFLRLKGCRPIRRTI